MIGAAFYREVTSRFALDVCKGARRGRGRQLEEVSSCMNKISISNAL